MFSVFRIKSVFRRFTLLLALCFINPITNAENLIPSLNSSNQNDDLPLIDGKIDESIWKNASKVALKYEIEPGENLTSVIKTDAYIFEDSEFLYIAIDASDPEPEKIRAYLTPRDKLSQSDYIQIQLDTFNDSRKAYQFEVNAIGIQGDGIVDETAGNVDTGWDAIWESAGTINQSGYQVEIKIPFKSLRFKRGRQLKKWGIRFSRIWHRDVTYIFSNSMQSRDDECGLCESQKFVGMKDSRPTNNLTLIPALTLSQIDEKPDDEWQSGELENRESLDIRWGITENTLLNATINPDFSQIEADDIELDANHPFAIYTPEKRTFFLDGADYFSNWSRLIYTKLFKEPEYGVKITGNSGAHSYGLMSLKDKDTTFLIPGNQSSRLVTLEGVESENQMLRYRYDLGNSSNFGMTFTNRQAEGYENQMLSFDGRYRVSKSDSVKFQYLNSESLYPEQVDQDKNLSGSAISANYTHIGRDWNWIFTYHRFGEDFRADSGFVSKSNWEQRAVMLSHHWYPSSQELWWKKASLTTQWNETSDLDHFQLGKDKQLELFVNGIYQSTVGVWMGQLNEFYVDQMFNKNVYEVFAGFTPVAGLDLEIDYTWGNEIDYSAVELADVKTMVTTVGYQVNQNWRFTVEHVNQLLERDNQQVYDVSFYNTRLSYQLNVHSFFRLTIQGENDQIGRKQNNSNLRELGLQLLYSYQVNPFTLFYLGYSDSSFKDFEERHLERDKRKIFMKFSYALQL